MKSRRIRHRKYRKKIMRGGYTQEQNNTLNQLGFTMNQIQYLENLEATYEQIMNKINEVQSRTNNELAVEDIVMEELQNELMNQSIPQALDDNHEMDIDNADEDFLNLSDLNVSERFSGNTSYEDNSEMDGGRRRQTNKKRQINKRRTNKKRKINKKRKTNKRRTNKKRTKYNGKGGKGMTDTEDTDPIGYREDEYDQLKNALNY